MKILVLTHEFPPVGGGGGQASRDICRGLTKRGHDVMVLTAHFNGLPRQEVMERIQVRRLPSLRREAFRAGLPAMGAYILVGLLAGYRLIRQWRPDLIHVHFAVPAGVLAWILSCMTRVPYVLTVHLGDVPGGVPEKTGKWFRWLFPFTRPIWRDAKRVVAVSEYTRRLALQNYPVEIEVIYNGVDVQAARNSLLDLPATPQVVFAGRFVPQKDPLQIVRSLAELKDLDWHCTMLGDGQLRGDVASLIRVEGLEDRFTLTGWVTPDDVAAWFARSDLLFMPSLSEGLPVVGVQALACGLAVVASDIGGFLDIVEDGHNGFLVDRARPSEFSRALRQLLGDPARLRQFRQASLERAARFDIARVVEQYEKVFGEITHAV